jgi:ribosomal protein S24E
VAENYKTIETEKELLMEMAHNLNREFVRQEVKKNIIQLTEEEWRSVGEAHTSIGHVRVKGRTLWSTTPLM